MGSEDHEINLYTFYPRDQDRAGRGQQQHITHSDVGSVETLELKTHPGQARVRH